MSWLGPCDYRWESELPAGIEAIVSCEAIRTSRWMLLHLASPCVCQECRASKKPRYLPVTTLLVPDDGLKSAQAHYPDVLIGYLSQEGLLPRGTVQ